MYSIVGTIETYTGGSHAMWSSSCKVLSLQMQPHVFFNLMMIFMVTNIEHELIRDCSIEIHNLMMALLLH